jgi:hypothetical protein
MVARIHLERDILDRWTHRIESRKTLLFRQGRLRLAFGKDRSLDKEQYLEHAIMTGKAHTVARLVKIAARIWESQRHGWYPALRGINADDDRPLLLEPNQKLYWAGHLASISALPVLTNPKFAPLRFSCFSLSA